MKSWTTNICSKSTPSLTLPHGILGYPKTIRPTVEDRGILMQKDRVSICNLLHFLPPATQLGIGKGPLK